LAILINERTRVLIQGVTGEYGSNQTKIMKEYGTKVVAGVSPGKGGDTIHGIPVYNTVRSAVTHHRIDASVIYVSAKFAKDAILDAIHNGIKLILVAAEGIPVHDTIYVRQVAKKHGAWIVGPNTIGMISPGKCLLGSLAPSFASTGHVGLISRSGTLAIEFTQLLTANGIGQSTTIGIGGDTVIGNNPIEYLKKFEEDPETSMVVLIGEIGGTKEMEAADFIQTMKKPVIAFIAGVSAPPGKRMGHIGAIVSGESESAQYKKEVLRKAGAIIADTPWDLISKIKGIQLKEFKKEA
jgi:succinyl-CoA synthetase alpha subunit